MGFAVKAFVGSGRKFIARHTIQFRHIDPIQNHRSSLAVTQSNPFKHRTEAAYKPAREAFAP